MKSTVLQSFLLTNRVALVTGAGGQLGAGFAESLAQAGARVVLADVDVQAAHKVARRLTKAKHRCTVVSLDVTKRASVVNAKNEILRVHRRLDILVNNAGMGVFTPFWRRTDQEFTHVMDVNLRSVFLCSQVMGQAMRKRGQGVIVNIGSVYGLVSPDPRIYGPSKRNSSEVYGATKAGVIQMTRYLATHLAPHGIRVNAISPGGVFNHQRAAFVRNYSRKTPLGRMADVHELQGALVYLASDAARYVTGHNLVVDGGFSVW